MATNNFLPFAPTDTGTNLLTQSEYAVASDRTNGNQPGVASSKLNNKAIRQSAFITSQFAQFVSDQSNTDVLDDALPVKLLAQINATIKPLAPTVTSYLSGSGTHYLTYIFFIASGSATAGATYTNNGFTFTVKSTVASAVQISLSGTGAPTASGTLTKASGTGDSTLTFYARRAPISLEATLVGGGAGGGGGTNGTDGGAGGDTTFGAATAGGGLGGGAGNAPAITKGIGGTGSLGGLNGVAFIGNSGTAGIVAAALNSNAGDGGAGYFGGSGVGYYSSAGAAGKANTGSGGAGGSTSANSQNAGSGGGAGGNVFLYLSNLATSYAYSIGSGGTAGTGGTNGLAGGAGGSGIVIVEEAYQ